MIPAISNFFPSTAFPGSKITIYGNAFTGATGVQFGGYDALTYRVVSDAIIEAYLGVDGDGIVSVTTNEGTGSLAGFTQQKIKKKIPDFPALGRVAVSGDKVLVWAEAEGKTVYADVSDLPFGAGGGSGSGSITYQSGLWKVRTFSAGFNYDATAGNSVIADIRLIGIDDGVITSTQVGGEFRDDQLVFDPEGGTVTLLNFELSGNEHITININGAANFAYNSALQNALTTIADQAKIISPFKPTPIGPNGAKVLWLRPANEIPPGWQECTAMRGRFPMAQDPNDDDFKGQIGTATGGGKTKTLTMDNIPEHDHDYRVSAYGGIQADRLENDVIKGGNSFGLYKGQTLKTSKAGKANPDALNLLNPFRIVMWIEYVGLD